MKWGIASVKKWNPYQAESILSADEFVSNVSSRPYFLENKPMFNGHPY